MVFFCWMTLSSFSQEVLEGSPRANPWGPLFLQRPRWAPLATRLPAALSSREIKAAGSRPISHLLPDRVSPRAKRDKELDDIRAGSSHASWVTFTSSQSQTGLRKRRLKSDSVLVWISHNFDGKPWVGERIHYRNISHRSPEEAGAWRWWERWTRLGSSLGPFCDR